eukprot:161562-Pyramimonas_sp.AAC.1
MSGDHDPFAGIELSVDEGQTYQSGSPSAVRRGTQLGIQCNANCDRCGEGPGASYHRDWGCSHNRGAVAYLNSEFLEGQARTQHEMHA